MKATMGFYEVAGLIWMLDGNILCYDQTIILLVYLYFHLSKASSGSFVINIFAFMLCHPGTKLLTSTGTRLIHGQW